MNTYCSNFQYVMRLSKKKRYQGLMNEKDLKELYGGKVGKTITSINEIVPSKKPTAFFMISASGTGKTTWCKSFSKLNQNVRFISIDDASLKCMTKFGPILGSNDEVICSEVGDILEETAKAKQSVILDGIYLHVFTRLALVRTLKALGYEICAIYNTDMYRHDAYALDNRALDFTLEEVCRDKYPDNIDYKDITSTYHHERANFYCEKTGKSRQFYHLKYQHTDTFKNWINVFVANYHEEMSSSGFAFQDQVGAFAYGIDYLLKISF